MSEIKWYALSVDETLGHLKTDLELGLTSDEVLRRQKIYHFNQIITYKHDGILRRFFRQFHHALIYILLASVAITIYLMQWVDASVIFGVIIINAVFGFFQEGKAEKALSSIRNMLAPSAQVIRDGKKIIVPAATLVPGDIVVINRGDKVPADLRLAETKNLQVQEGILTGESLPIEKDVVAVLENIAMGERYSMLYSGTLITDGRGLGVVVAIGTNTEVGKISEALAGVETIDTPLLRQMNRFGHWLTVLIVVLAVVVFLVGAFVWHDLSKEMFVAIVSFTVAAVPEGLPPIMTIILAIGVARMAKQKAIVRRLPAVETMGSVTTICTDKTGTLTSNELAAQSVVTAKQIYLFNGELPKLTDDPDLQTAIVGVVLCNDAELHHHDYETHGNPIDSALMMLGSRLKFNQDLLEKKFPRTDLIPYETEHKFMATLHHDHGGNSFIYVKGAPEILLKKCKSQQVDGLVMLLDESYWQENIDKLADEGQRVIAVATKKIVGEKSTLNFSDVEDDLVMVGLFGLIDPPREEAIVAIKECQEAGIKVKMITGDHAATAEAIARHIGIHDGDVLTGDMIDLMSDEDLVRLAPLVNIYARTTPHHKLRLVQALQKLGEVVAMTGDGINDAPALKQADIGIAMGQKGADIARESSAMVLADDNFATIVHAVSEGRTIYDNLQKAILFILPTSFAQAFAVMIAILFGLTLPITAVQILWVNMITAVTLALAFGFEQAESDIMQRPPRDLNVSLLSWHLMWRVILVSLVLVAVVFGAFIFVYHRGLDLELSRTVAVNVLVMGEIMYLINCRNLKKSSMNLRAFFGSKPALLSIVMMLMLQLLFTYMPLMQRFFNTASIGFDHWGYIIIAAMVAFGLVEVEKAVLRR